MPASEMLEQVIRYNHRSNSANKSGWVGVNRPWLLEVKSTSHVIRRGKIVLNQSLIYIHSFPPIKPQSFYLPFHYVAKKIFLDIKILQGHPPSCTLRSYAYGYKKSSLKHFLARCSSHHLP